MPEPILDPRYWRKRLDTAGEEHHAVFKCPLDRWRRIEEKHRRILATTILDHHSVLDAGCGWGRLLSLMPSTWDGTYVGVDLSTDFITKAAGRYPGRMFMVADLRQLPLGVIQIFDWAVLVSVRPMVKRNIGESQWDIMEKGLRAVANRLLYLEYDEDDEGSVE